MDKKVKAMVGAVLSEIVQEEFVFHSLEDTVGINHFYLDMEIEDGLKSPLLIE
jgi:hypothetical protein